MIAAVSKGAANEDQKKPAAIQFAAGFSFHSKPTGLLNTNDFYNGLQILINGMAQNGFLKMHDKERVLISD